MRSSVSLLIIFCLLLLNKNATAQLQYANWFFGNGAGVSFVNGNPVSVSGGMIFTDEGCSTVSDAAANLMFSTDGRFVYNANHQQMPNRFGLYGDISSTHFSKAEPLCATKLSVLIRTAV